MSGTRAPLAGAEDILWNGTTYRRYPDHDNRSRAVYYTATTGRRAYLHRDIYEHHHGPIPDGWHVHHVDHDPSNNSPENLRAMSPEAHAALHGDEFASWPAVCAGCGATFAAKRPWARWCGSGCKQQRRRDLGIAYKRPRKGPWRDSRRCEECDAEYVAKRPWSRFCTPACKQRASRRSQA